jgi:hypothetical protein
LLREIDILPAFHGALVLPRMINWGGEMKL